MRPQVAEELEQVKLAQQAGKALGEKVGTENFAVKGSGKNCGLKWWEFGESELHDLVIQWQSKLRLTYWLAWSGLGCFHSWTRWTSDALHPCEVLSDSRAIEQEKMARLDEVQLQLKDLDVGVGWCALPTLRWSQMVVGDTVQSGREDAKK